MNDHDIFINRIVQGGIYFLTLQDDMKMRPYVVISKDSGYGMNILAFSITSKFTTSNAVLPIVLSNKVSFIRISGTKEILPKTIIKSDFGGIVRPDIFSLAITLFVRRFMNVSDPDNVRHEVDVYLDELESKQFPLHSDESIIFTKERFLNDNCENSNNKATLGSLENNEIVSKVVIKAPHNNDTIKKPIHRIIKPIKKEYPQDIKDWAFDDLKKFRTDMFRYSIEELMERYSSSKGRVCYLKRQVKLEIQRRKER